MLPSDDLCPPVLCRECGLPYEEHGLDITLPDEQWLMIHPQDGGVLCGTCIAKRAERLPRAIAIRAYIELASDYTTSWARIPK